MSKIKKVKKRFTISLTTFLLLPFLVVLALLITIINNYTKIQYDNIVTELSNEVISQVNQTVIEKTINFMAPAISIAETSAKLFESGTLSNKNINQFETYALSMLKPYPHLKAFYYGDEKGNFMMSNRLLNNAMETKIINTNQNTTLTTTYNLFGKTTDHSVKKSITYDPRPRPWYKGTKAIEQEYWTDVYIFYTGKKPGITAGYPVFNADNRFQGVVGVDIELSEISNLLETAKLSDDTIIFIINENNKLIAFPNLESHFEKIINDDPIDISEINTAHIKQAIEIYQNLSTDKFLFSDENTEYVASFAQFPTHFGEQWKIVQIVPMTDFIAPIKNNLYHYGIFLVIMVLLIWVLIRLTCTPINRSLRDILAKIKHRDKPNNQSSIIREINNIENSLS